MFIRGHGVSFRFWICLRYSLLLSRGGRFEMVGVDILVRVEM